MSSEYGEKSREDLKGTARAQIKKAETSVPCTAIMDVNWKALIAAMNTQVDMLSEIQESLKTLATKRVYHHGDGSAVQDTDRVRREQSGADRTVHGDDGADGDGIYRTDEYGSREFILTGWENERAILTESLFGAGNGESVYEAEYLDLADPDGSADHLGTDTAYLFADLTNIIDEDSPVEDCTTMHQPRRQKKNTGPVMGGM